MIDSHKLLLSFAFGPDFDQFLFFVLVLNRLTEFEEFLLIADLFYKSLERNVEFGFDFVH